MYNRFELENAILRKLPSGKQIIDCKQIGLVELTNKTIQYVFAYKHEEDKDTEILREAWLDITEKGQFNFSKE